MCALAIFINDETDCITLSLPHSFLENHYSYFIDSFTAHLGEGRSFVLDLSQNERLDMVILGGFLVLKERVEKQKGTVTLLNAHGQTLALLHRVNFEQLFEFTYSEAGYDI